MFFPSSFSLLCYPVHLPKVKRNLRSSQLTKMKEVKECEKGCVQAEGKPPKFQSSLIMLHLVWESCTSKERMNGRRIKAQIWLFQDSWCALDEEPPVFHEDFLEGEDKPFSIAECFVCEVLAVQPCRPTSVPPFLLWNISTFLLGGSWGFPQLISFTSWSFRGLHVDPLITCLFRGWVPNA